MNTLPPIAHNAVRNLWALFVLGFVVTTPWVLLGAGLLIACRHRPDMTKPMWEYGQTMLLLSAINFAMLVGLFTQVRRLRKSLTAQANASPRRLLLLLRQKQETELWGVRLSGGSEL